MQKKIIVIKVDSKRRELLIDYLIAHPNVKDFHIINSAYNFLIETNFMNTSLQANFENEVQVNFYAENINKYNIIESKKDIVCWNKAKYKI